MRRTAKKWAILTGVLVGFIGVSANWLKAHDYDFWRYAEYRQELDTSESLTRELDQRLESSEQRLSEKELIVRDFLDRHLTFADVAERFYRLNEAGGRIAVLVRDQYPSADDREAAARNAFNFIHASLAKNAPQGQAVLAQMRSEFDRLFPHAASISGPAG